MGVGGSLRAAGGQAGTDSASPGGERRLCFLTWSWWRGKLFVTTLLLSHLLIEKHRAGTAEWKAVLPDASSPGVSRHTAAGLHTLPPDGRDQERVSPALEDSPSEKRKKSKGLYKDSRILVLLLLLPVFLKTRYQTPLTSLGRNVTSATSEQACEQAPPLVSGEGSQTQPSPPWAVVAPSRSPSRAGRGILSPAVFPDGTLTSDWCQRGPPQHEW